MQQIEFSRIKLNEFADKKGYTHEETIRVSQQLDHLLNQLRKSTG